MPFPWVNAAFGLVVVVQILTGVGGLLAGAESFDWVVWMHGAGGYAVIALAWFKGAVVWRSLRRKRLRAPIVVFAGMATMLVAVVATGLWWTHGGAIDIPGTTLVVIHGVLGAGVGALMIWHFAARRRVLRHPAATGRRMFMGIAAGAAAGAGLRFLSSVEQRLLGLPGASRRFTGSYETGSYTGIFPATSWATDRPDRIDVARWQLRIDGAVQAPVTLAIDAILELEAVEIDAILDCTGGYWTAQIWKGVPLADVLDLAGLHPSAVSVTVESVTGYTRRFSLDLAADLLLATHVGGRRLTHGHGAPLRLVVPGQRGFAWVKWITRLEVNETGAIWQSPFPLQ